MLTKVYHPSVSDPHNPKPHAFCLHCFGGKHWHPRFKIVDTLERFYNDLLVPKLDIDSFKDCNPEMSYIIEDDLDLFQARAREWT